EIDSLFSVPLPRFHLFLLSGRSHDLDIHRFVVESRSDCAARQAGCAEYQDPRLSIVFAYFHNWLVFIYPLNECLFLRKRRDDTLLAQVIEEPRKHIFGIAAVVEAGTSGLDRAGDIGDSRPRTR